jgi:hypothetical protein
VKTAGSPPYSHLRQKQLYSETKQNKSDTVYPAPVNNKIWEAGNTGVLLQNMNGNFTRKNGCPAVHLAVRRKVALKKSCTQNRPEASADNGFGRKWCTQSQGR